MKDWIYDEFRHVGVDYSEKNAAASYDDQMERFRDYEGEVAAFIEKLRHPDIGGAIAVDVGCGTGAFCLAASKYFKRVHAVDVSEEMLNVASKKAALKHIENITFHNAGFLSFQPKEKADVVCAKWALHHLPDYWKQAALLKINAMLKAGGALFLTDLVFSFSPDLDNAIETLLSHVAENHAEDFLEETKTHIREEFSTFDWILRGLIERAGFRIENVMEDRLASEYFCRKITSFEGGIER